MSGTYGKGPVDPPDDRPLSREEAVRSDLAKRLRRVCAHLSEEEFSELVHKMAERQIRGERGRPFS